MQVVLCGAGLVGRAVIRLLGELPCSVFWLDRPLANFPEELASNIHPVSGGVEQMCNLPANACWLVMTDDDLLDFDWVEQILLRGDARFIGLLGCRGKLASFNVRLINRVPLGSIASVHCPLGIEGISSRQPAVMAISIVAQLMQQLKPD
ncbi:XdhC family protein [Aquitalea sp. LB_tupeE]|uniref:XdhC family protein n=1 Tax=Aquitalea sp. LB_tupeE TaxID=2748078 RepID=UPI0015BBD413|nr:XdhC family protein [Aquitalea sp. LB_tupeE]NWK78566.1 XdhC family protein [Aquitalea sp. LB_tupeE]